MRRLRFGLMRSLRLHFVAPAKRMARVPEGQRVYAVGDIHGCLDLLVRLTEMIREDDAARPSANTTIVFLGDLVDRGPDSRGVIDFLQSDRLAPMAAVVLGGNHDEVLVRVLAGERDAVSALHRMGGRATALSYGISADEYDRGTFDDLTGLLIERVPPDHASFLRSLREWYAIGDYVFVHAGIRPGTPMNEQKAKDMRWIRDPFLNHAGDHGAVIVHGHTITGDAQLGLNRISIDTGAYASRKLTALGLQGAERWLLST
jgi:serine/threonine protein phosphatase 1